MNEKSILNQYLLRQTDVNRCVSFVMFYFVFCCFVLFYKGAKGFVFVFVLIVCLFVVCFYYHYHYYYYLFVLFMSKFGSKCYNVHRKESLYFCTKKKANKQTIGLQLLKISLSNDPSRLVLGSDLILNLYCRSPPPFKVHVMCKSSNEY